MKLLILFLFTFGPTQAVFAFEETTLPLNKLSISQKFSDQDDVVLRADLTYPNGCYQSYRQVDKTFMDKEAILLENKALVANGLCTQAVEYDTVYFNLKEHQPGEYKLFDGHDMSLIGELKVDNSGEHKLIQ